MKKQLLISTLAIASPFLFSSFAQAESTTGNADVIILETITFNEIAAVDFGSITNADGNCAMASNGALSGQCAGRPNGTVGDFTVSGTAGQAVNVAVSNGSTSGGVTFNPVLASSATPTLVGGNTTVNVMGSLDLVSATAGAKALTYTLTVNYQ